MPKASAGKNHSPSKKKSKPSGKVSAKVANTATDSGGSDSLPIATSRQYRLSRTLAALVRRPADVKPQATLPPAWKIAKTSLLMLRQNWILFSGIMLIYAVLMLILVGGYAFGTDQSVRTILKGGSPSLSSELSAFLQLAGTTGGGSDAGSGTYRFVLTVITGLALVWALRQVWAGTANIRIRDAFYLGMYPLIPVFLILLVISLQLLPFLLGSVFYVAVVVKGIASTPVEYIIVGLICLFLLMWTVYMVISSIFALYIAALPDMTPMRALRSARQLVRYRRLSVLRKLLFLPLVLLIGSLVIMLPVLFLLTPIAAIVFIILTMVSLPVIHSYLYTLYRELLN